MKIVILGAGQVGASVAENLVRESNDITVVDIDADKLQNLQDRFDLRTVHGFGSHPSVLRQAGIEDADMLLAVTQSDETNLVACKRLPRCSTPPPKSPALAHRARMVTTLELRPALAKMAADNLRRAAIANVTVREADGAAGLPGEAPFDVILLSGSVAVAPAKLLEQLKPGGRLLAIVGHEPAMSAVRITRLDDRSFSTESLFETVAPRLERFPEPGAFHF